MQLTWICRVFVSLFLGINQHKVKSISSQNKPRQWKRSLSCNLEYTSTRKHSLLKINAHIFIFSFSFHFLNKIPQRRKTQLEAAKHDRVYLLLHTYNRNDSSLYSPHTRQTIQQIPWEIVRVFKRRLFQFAVERRLSDYQKTKSKATERNEFYYNSHE